MKVALDYRPALFSRSGIARSVRELCRALSLHQPDISLHLFGHALRGVRFGEAPDKASLHRSRLPGRSLPLLSSLGLDAARLSGGSRLFHWTDYVYPPVGEDTLVVQTVHDLAFLSDTRFHGQVQSRILATRFAKALSRADCILCPSESTASDLRRHFPDHAPIHVIPFGVDHVARYEADAALGRATASERLGSEAPYLLCLGTLEPRKNQVSLIQAWERLPSPRTPLILVGAKGWETENLERGLQQSRQGLAWTGEISDADLFDLMAGARALLYPSSLEGFGFPPMEALELGVPPLVGDCSALREHLGGAALYVDGRDPLALGRAIQRIAIDEDLRSGILKNWQPRRTSLTWKISAQRHAQVYADLLHQGRHRRTR
jgi:glycosyltransferase involved in cell wall biosynthesis